MKSLIQSVVIAAALVAPVAVFAQSNAPVTRAQVKAELAQFEQANGPRALGNDPYYPASAQVAQARVEAQNGDGQAVGGVRAGSSDAGSPVTAAAKDSLYFGR
ncbi:DUF4148 domain-containing protein [Trinickia dinghuensis]|uniref:DUF4148 domain-containing protein n=1 Tax=Trinickia dinghuensis TaxID=2291023 RepID=A0A3D8JWX4_9BURK|nr:DUF4148 domain-containing protein [Trinickia dinghuensis]RDU97597.1 DUF4148 domain-containing protein [Trinickia dinghuensis]